MQSFTLVLLAALVTVAYAAGQFYVPRAYYTIDSDGHQSIPVPLRRLRRSIPYPYQPGNANAEATANNYGEGSANARAEANSYGGRGNWGPPSSAGYGASNPNLLTSGMTRMQSGLVLGRSVSANTVVGVDPSGYGAYTQTASVHD